MLQCMIRKGKLFWQKSTGIKRAVYKVHLHVIGVAMTEESFGMPIRDFAGTFEPCLEEDLRSAEMATISSL